MSAFDVILKKYGSAAVYHPQSGESVELRAFIQPIDYKNRQYIGGSRTELGSVDEGRWMYYGPAGTALSADGVSWLESGGAQYTVCRCENVRLGDGTHHVRAVLRLRREAA